MARKLTILPFLLIAFLHLAPPSSAQPEVDALLKFKASLTNAAALSNWPNPAPPCTGEVSNWIGVVCDNATVGGLQLQSMGLEGKIDGDALALLPTLKILSFAGNSFNGPLPNLAALKNLRVVSLSNNKLSGAIPANTFEGMAALATLDLDNNDFSGPIPTSLTGLPMLQELMLLNNGFQGEIPPFPKGQLTNFSVANNALSGEIPPGVSHLDASAFAGNKDLCGTPLALCASPPKHLSLGTKILVPILLAAALAALVAVIVILCCRRRRRPPQEPVDESVSAAACCDHVSGGSDLDRMERGEAPADPNSPGKTHQRRKSEGNVKITFLKEDRDPFDMTDLLKASAEILGSGIFGSTYKAALTEKQIVVVKRYRHMGNVSKQDFCEHMRRLGRLSHPNVLPLVAFYYRREEKLLVYDYVHNASLAAHLHGNSTTSSRTSPPRMVT